jgi:hypothetical protein
MLKIKDYCLHPMNRFLSNRNQQKEFKDKNNNKKISLSFNSKFQELRQ